MNRIVLNLKSTFRFTHTHTHIYHKHLSSSDLYSFCTAQNICTKHLWFLKLCMCAQHMFHIATRNKIQSSINAYVKLNIHTLSHLCPASTCTAISKFAKKFIRATYSISQRNISISNKRAFIARFQERINNNQKFVNILLFSIVFKLNLNSYPLLPIQSGEHIYLFNIVKITFAQL